MGSQRARATAHRRHSPRRGDGVAYSAMRLAIGACSLLVEEVGGRLEAAQQPEPAAARTRRHRSRAQRQLSSAGYAGLGLAMESADAAARIASALAAGGTRSVAVVATFRRLPGVAIVIRPLSSSLERMTRYTEELRRLGERETVTGRRIARRLVREMTSQSVREIADSAIKELTHSPEVAQLVRSQSAGVASGTILEVRANSEHADQAVERQVRSWLRILRPEHDVEQIAGESAAPPKPVA